MMYIMKVCLIMLAALQMYSEVREVNAECSISPPQYNDDNDRTFLPTRSQAIIPTYIFCCCGNITRWRAYLQPGGQFHTMVYTIRFQVWRPSMQDQELYNLVGETVANPATLDSSGEANIVPSKNITVQPDDVVGYFVSHKNRDEDGGIQLERSNHGNNIVWYSSAQVGSQQLQIGSRSSLLSTTAAPILRADVYSYPCPVVTSPASTASIETTSLASTVTTTTLSVSENESDPHHSSIGLSNNTDLTSKDNRVQIGVIIGSTLTAIVIFLTLLILTAILFALYLKQHSKHKGKKFYQNRITLEGSLELNGAYHSFVQHSQITAKQNHSEPMVETNIDTESTEDERREIAKNSNLAHSDSPMADSKKSFQQHLTRVLEKRNTVLSSNESTTESQSVLLGKKSHEAEHMSSNISYNLKTTTTDSTPTYTLASCEPETAAQYPLSSNNKKTPTADAVCMSANTCYEAKRNSPQDTDVVSVNPNACYETKSTHTNEISVRSNVCYDVETNPAHATNVGSVEYYEGEAPICNTSYKLCKPPTKTIYTAVNVCYDSEEKSTTKQQDNAYATGLPLEASTTYEPVQFVPT